MNDQTQESMPNQNYHNGNHAAIHEDILLTKDSKNTTDQQPKALETTQGHWITVNDGKHDYI